MVDGRGRATTLQFVGELIILRNELVDLTLDQIVLIVEHFYVVLERFRLSDQVEVLIVAPIIDQALLFNFLLKLFNDRSFFIRGICEASALVLNLPRLLLNRQSVLLKFIHL